jgi:hypothetical protein
LDESIEQLSGSADKWLPLLVLVGAGRLADEHHPSVGGSSSEDDVSAGVGETAVGARRSLDGELEEANVARLFTHHYS